MLSGCMVQPMLWPAGDNEHLHGYKSLNKAEQMVKCDMVFKMHSMIQPCSVQLKNFSNYTKHVIESRKVGRMA